MLVHMLSALMKCGLNANYYEPPSPVALYALKKRAKLTGC
jgi:hypothetical protein